MLLELAIIVNILPVVVESSAVKLSVPLTDNLQPINIPSGISKTPLSTGVLALPPVNVIKLVLSAAVKVVCVKLNVSWSFAYPSINIIPVSWPNETSAKSPLYTVLGMSAHLMGLVLRI